MGEGITLVDYLGFKREYKEARRVAREFEKIKPLFDDERIGLSKHGNYEVIKVELGQVKIDLTGFGTYFLPHSKYAVLEPTNILHIEKEKYKIEKRFPKLGEKILAIANDNDGHYKSGDIFEVLEKKDSFYSYNQPTPQRGKRILYFVGKREDKVELMPIMEAFLVITKIETNKEETSNQIEKEGTKKEVEQTGSVNKALIPKRIANALEELLEKHGKRYLLNVELMEQIGIGSYKTLAEYAKNNEDNYFKAVVNGYTIKVETKEDRIKEVYDELHDPFSKKAVKEILDILEMKINGINK